MITVRLCVLLIALSGIALAVVWLRAEQTRVAARALHLEVRWIEQRRALWAAQADVARLRTPHRIRHGVDWFETRLLPPERDTAPAEAVLVSD